MKKPIYILLLWFLTVLTFSCNDDFLDRPPLDEISDPSYWKTANDLELYVNGLYTQLGQVRNAVFLDENSDNALSSQYQSSRLTGTVSQTTDAIGSTYKNIRKINIMITNMSKVTDPEGDQYKGEAYFFRAWFYFDVLKSVGAAQIVKKPLSSNDEELYTILRSPRDSVADFILSDLDSAINLLKTKIEITKSGDGQRINKGAALAFKSRVALYEGSWEKYHNGTPFGVDNADYNKYFLQAADAAKTLMDEQSYSLDDDYQSLFTHHELSGNAIASDEIILARQWDRLKYNNATYGFEMMNEWPYAIGYTRSAMRSYLCTDGLPIGVSPLYQGDTSLATITKHRDPRLDMTLYTPGELWRISAIGDTTWFADPFTTVNLSSFYEPTGYTSQKFYTYDLEQAGANRLTWDEILIYFRYGEVLLNYAEAMAELGKFDQATADISINKLRSRPSVNMPPLEVNHIVTDPDWPDWGYTLSPLLQEIRRERRVELMGESFRFDDLMRWAGAKLIVGQNYRGAYFEPIMNNGEGKNIPRDDDNYFEPYKDELPTGYQFDPERDYLLPFPQNQIVLNPKLTPNPGW